MRLRLQSPFTLALAAWTLAAYGRLVFATARVRVVGPIPSALRQGPVLLALWHQHIFAVPLLAKPNRPHPLVGLMSPSADGRLTRQVAKRYGIGAAVGSSSRQGVAGARELVRLAKQGHSLFLTPDGPRGPARVAKNGATELARLTGLPLIPCALTAVHPKLTFRSWDTFWLPLPFARFTLRYGPALPPKAGAAQLSAALNALLDSAA
ncbi:MAG: DUF374 domain-containing protein [Alphaproteobacteria bacterium]|jgi:lysophospholipid acyltransferase (LPLAT)-like uncharacterized protein|nr:DUF374 domain-containing protein [Alphaproteobacteria bacterium]